MITKKQAIQLFDKYLNDQCSPSEKELLERYLDSFQDKNRLWSELRYDEEIKEKIWTKVKSRTIESEAKKKKRILPEVLKYAAIFVGVLFSVYVWRSFQVEQTPKLVIEDDAVVLKTGENAMTKIDLDNQGAIKNDIGNAIASQDKGVISYQSNTNTKELVYNEIIVPRGKTFELVLSDGTLVHLNSQTELKFPVHFIKGQDRKVFLNGEAYFEVAKDAEHPFTVMANDINVKVLGTHFAVNSYGSTEDYAVLVEGSVAVKTQDMDASEETIIEPGQKASLVKDGIEVRNVDVQDYIGWRTGKLFFNNEPFSEIVEKIERKYNVEINNAYNELAPVRFNGKFDDETIEDLLDTFKESAGFNYEIIDNKVIINKPL